MGIYAAESMGLAEPGEKGTEEDLQRVQAVFDWDCNVRNREVDLSKQFRQCLMQRCERSETLLI